MSLKIEFKGNEVNIKKFLNINEKINTFTLVNSSLEEVSLETLLDKPLVISTIPSIDTGVCAKQSIELTKLSAKYKDYKFITVSLDLPFAASRWCEANNSNMNFLSDYKYKNFTNDLGFELSNLGLLTRSVLIIGKDQHIKYIQYVKEVTNEPNYQELESFIN